MRPPININDDGELGGLYREMIESLDVSDLELVGRKLDGELTRELRETYQQFIVKADLAGFSPEECAKVIIINGLTILAVCDHRRRLSSQN